MPNRKIKGGATIWARQTIDSDIFFWRPDKWFKIWFFIVNKVNHTDTKLFRRGSNLTTYDEISHYTKTTKNQIDHFIRYAKKEQMLATQKTTRGMVVSVLKYDFFQDLNNYKSDTESELQAKHKRNTSDTINKNDNNDKNDNLSIAIRDYWNSYLIPKVSGYRNLMASKLLPECRKITPDIEMALSKILRTYGQEDIEAAIKNYVADILNRNPENDFAKHRFSLFEFLKQSNGFTKFNNK